MRSCKILKITTAFFFLTAVLTLPNTSLAQSATTTEEAASSTIEIELNVRSGNNLIHSSTISLDKSATTTIDDSSGNSHVISYDSVLGLILKADELSDGFRVSDLGYFSSFDSFIINCIETTVQELCDNWQYVVNDEYPMVGVDKKEIFDGDVVYLYYGTPRRFELSATSTYATIPVEVSVGEYNYTDNSWSPLPGVVVGATQPNPDDAWNPLVPYSTITDQNSVAILGIDKVGIYDVGLAVDSYFPTKALKVLEVGTSSVTLRLRAGESLFYESALSLPDAGTTTVNDSLGNPRVINKHSPLYLLLQADELSDSFEVSNLEYFQSFESFYLKCIKVDEEFCDNWQYAIDGDTPGVSIDTYKLEGGEEIFAYFAVPRKVSLSKTEIKAEEDFEAQALKYDFRKDIYKPLLGVTIGVTKKNPESSFSPLVLATSTTNSEGKARFVLNEVGEYGVGIAEDFYFPLTHLSVTESSQGSGETLGEDTEQDNESDKLDIEKALSFLKEHQRGDGSFGADIYTDWVAVGVGAARSFEPDILNDLRDYLLEDEPNYSIITDFERRAMAIMSLGINPYDATDTNYIEEIVNSFDGEQIGKPGLVNDDIFALFPLLRAGFDESDEIIERTVKFILSRQEGSGRFESPDLTGAAIQALSEVEQINGVESALDKSTRYLESIQEDDGGFGNVPATSWIMQGLVSMGINPSDWKKGSSNPESFLARKQVDDGGLLDENESINNRIWATAYAITAALERDWFDILEDFPKQETEFEEEEKKPAGNSEAEEEGEDEEQIEEESASTTPGVLGQATTTQEKAEDKSIGNNTPLSEYSNPYTTPKPEITNANKETPKEESSSSSTVDIFDERKGKQEEQGSPYKKVVVTLSALVVLGIVYKSGKN